MLSEVTVLARKELYFKVFKIEIACTNYNLKATSEFIMRATEVTLQLELNIP